MANSGRLKSNYVDGGYSLVVDWETLSQDVAANTSEVKCSVKLISNGSSYTISSTAQKDLKLTVDGKAYTATVGVALKGNEEKTLFTKTVIVSHDSDGTKNLSISATVDVQVTISGTYYASFMVSGNATLTTIPRQSEISSVTESVSVDGKNKLTVTINRKSSSYTHDVRIKFGAYETTLTGVGTTTSYVVPTTWLEAIPNSTSGTGTVFVTTKSGSTQIGSTVSKRYTLTVPTDAVPSFTSLDVSRVDGDVPETWGIYVQNKSQCAVTITGAAGVYGSTVKGYAIEVGSVKGSAATLTASLPTAGTVTIKGTVTDSRGRTYSKTSTISVEAYKPPVLDVVRLYRADSTGTESDEGTYLGGNVTFTYSAIGGNAVNASIEYRLAGATEWTYGGAITSGTAFLFGNGALSVDNAYEIRLGVADSLAWFGKIEYLPTGFTLLDLRKGGKGIAFGKVAESDGFEVALDARFRNPVTFDYAESLSSLDVVSNVQGGFTVTSCNVAKWGRFCTVYMTAKTTNAIDAGNIANKTVCTLKETLRPVAAVPLCSGATGGVTSGHLSTAGNVVLASVAQSISAGGEFSLGGSFVCTDTSGKI